jgi:hypothetical protein
LGRKESEERKRPGKISHFYLEEKRVNLIFVVPKANKCLREFEEKRKTLLRQGYGGRRFFEIMKYTTRRDMEILSR